MQSSFPRDIGDLGELDKKIKEGFKVIKKDKKHNISSNREKVDLGLKNKEGLLEFHDSYCNNNNSNSINTAMDCDLSENSGLLTNNGNEPKSMPRGRGINLNSANKQKRTLLAVMQADKELPVKPKDFLDYTAKKDQEYFESASKSNNPKRRKQVARRLPWYDNDSENNSNNNNNNNSINAMDNSNNNSINDNNNNSINDMDVSNKNNNNSINENVKVIKNNKSSSNRKYTRLDLNLIDNGISTVTDNVTLGDLYESDEFNHILTQMTNDNNNNSKDKQGVVERETGVSKLNKNDGMQGESGVNSDDLACVDLFTPGGPDSKMTKKKAVAKKHKIKHIAVINKKVEKNNAVINAESVGKNKAVGSKGKAGKGRSKRNYPKLLV